MQLTAFVYENIPEEVGPYGMQHGQKRPQTMGAPCLVYVGWFNHRGEIVGGGNVNRDDVLHLAANLDKDDRFIIVQSAALDELQIPIHEAVDVIREAGELNAYCPHCWKHRETGRHITRMNPGTLEVYEHSTMIIERGSITMLTEHGDSWWREHWFTPDVWLNEVDLRFIRKEEVKAHFF